MVVVVVELKDDANTPSLAVKFVVAATPLVMAEAKVVSRYALRRTSAHMLLATLCAERGGELR